MMNKAVQDKEIQSELQWVPGSLCHELKDSHVHVWRIDIPSQIGHLTYCLQLLSDVEIQRGKKFKFDADYNRFTISKAILRKLLGHYIGIVPSRLQFSTNQQGKPSIFGDLGSNLEFNVSHSGQYALIAVARNARVGVDIEQFKQIGDLDSLAQRAFSPSEYAAFNSVPESQSQSVFYATWTRKEAFMKALGVGLSQPLDSFSVAVLPDDFVEFKALPDGQQDADWKLYSLESERNYAASLVVEGKQNTPILFDWQSENLWLNQGCDAYRQIK